jgi:hypothetical protein
MSTAQDKVVRIPGRLWPEVEAYAREQMRTPPEMVRVIVEKTLRARRMKQREEQGGVANRAIVGGVGNAGQ